MAKVQHSVSDIRKEIHRAHANRDWSEESKLWNMLGNHHKENGSWNEAVDCYEKDYAICQRFSDSRGLMVTCQRLGEVLVSLRRMEEAVPYLEQQLSLAQDVGDMGQQQRAHTQLGNYHYELFLDLEDQPGSAARANAELARAEEHRRQALELAKYYGGGDHESLADAYNNLGMCLAANDNFEDARRCFEDGLRHANEEEYPRACSRLHNSMGDLYMKLRDFDRALHHMNKDRDICMARDNREDRGKALLHLGNLYRQHERPAQAIQSYKMARREFRHLKDGEFYLVAVKEGIEVVEHEEGLRSAIASAEAQLEALPVGDTTGDPRVARKKAALLETVVMGAEELSKWDKITAAAPRLLRLLAHLGDPRRRARAHELLGNALFNKGRHALAVAEYEEGVKLFSAVNDVEGKARCAINLGNAHDGLKQHESAAQAYLDALSSLRSLQTPEMLALRVQAAESLAELYEGPLNQPMSGQCRRDEAEELQRQLSTLDPEQGGADTVASLSETDDSGSDRGSQGVAGGDRVAGHKGVAGSGKVAGRNRVVERKGVARRKPEGAAARANADASSGMHRGASHGGGISGDDDDDDEGDYRGAYGDDEEREERRKQGGGMDGSGKGEGEGRNPRGLSFDEDEDEDEEGDKENWPKGELGFGRGNLGRHGQKGDHAAVIRKTTPSADVIHKGPPGQRGFVVVADDGRPSTDAARGNPRAPGRPGGDVGSNHGGNNDGNTVIVNGVWAGGRARDDAVRPRAGKPHTSGRRHASYLLLDDDDEEEEEEEGVNKRERGGILEKRAARSRPGVDSGCPVDGDMPRGDNPKGGARDQIKERGRPGRGSVTGLDEGGDAPKGSAEATGTDGMGTSGRGGGDDAWGLGGEDDGAPVASGSPSPARDGQGGAELRPAKRSRVLTDEEGGTMRRGNGGGGEDGAGVPCSTPVGVLGVRSTPPVRPSQQGLSSVGRSPSDQRMGMGESKGGNQVGLTGQGAIAPVHHIGGGRGANGAELDGGGLSGRGGIGPGDRGDGDAGLMGARVTSENGRVTSDSGRVPSEDGRLMGEYVGVASDNGRVTEDGGRGIGVTGNGNRGVVTSENGRVTADGIKGTAMSVLVDIGGQRLKVVLRQRPEEPKRDVAWVMAEIGRLFVANNPEGPTPVITGLSHQGVSFAPVQLAEDVLADVPPGDAVEVSVKEWVGRPLLDRYNSHCAQRSLVPNAALCERFGGTDAFQRQLEAGRLDLGGVGLTDAHAWAAMGALGPCEFAWVECVDLHDNNLTNQVVVFIEDMLQRREAASSKPAQPSSGALPPGPGQLLIHPDAIKLDLSGNNLSASCVSRMLKCPRLLECLDSLDLSYSTLTDAVSCHLARLVAAAPALRSLKLADCGIAGPTFHALASALTTSASLAELCIGHNPGAGEGVASLVASLAKLQGFTALDLSAVELDGRAMSAIGVLAMSRSLKSLLLAGTEFGDVGAQALCAPWSKSPGGIEEATNPATPAACPRVNQVQLALCGLSGEGASLLCEAFLSQTKGLTALSLRGNLLGMRGARALASLLKRPGCRLKELDVGWCGLGYNGMLHVAEAVPTGPLSSLTDLRADENKEADLPSQQSWGESTLMECFVEPLCRWMVKCRTLAMLNLDGNGLSDAHIQQLNAAWSSLQRSASSKGGPTASLVTAGQRGSGTTGMQTTHTTGSAWFMSQ